MYLISVSFYGSNFGYNEQTYIIPCQNAEKALKRLSKQIREDYDSNEYMIEHMEYLHNTEILEV